MFVDLWLNVILLYQNKKRTTRDTIVHNRNKVFNNVAESQILKYR